MRTAVVTFTLAAVVIVLLPGPDTLVVVRSLVRHGRLRAVLTVGGVLTGLAVWVAAAALGLSALLRASENGYTALRVVGAVYLVWLGVRSLRARSVGGADPLLVDGVDTVVVPGRRGHAALLVVAGRVTGWMNDPRIRRRLERVTGVILIGFGLRLAVERA